MGNNFKGKCNVPFCVREIDAHNFDCGHMVSEYNGGSLDISNLIPICRICNSSMGKTNYNDYIEKSNKTPNKVPENQEYIPQIEKSNDYVVAFCGLPSSGKSSIINSLVGKRLLQSGVCRTTTKEKLLDEIVTDDDKNKFKIYDLPGIADSEEKLGTKNDFTNITEAYVTSSNLVCWVSDVSKAFITTHEVDAYKNIKALLEKRTRETGDIYDVCIILSKCDITDDCSKQKNKIATTYNVTNNEITDDDEDTTIVDIIQKVKEKFPSDTIKLFNAYGRSYHEKNTSTLLKQFIKKQCNGAIPLNINTQFSISKFAKTYFERTETSYLKYFTDCFNKYLVGQYKFDDLYKYYIRLNSQSRQNIMLSNTEDLTKNFCETDISNSAKYEFIKKAFDEDNLEIFVHKYDIFALYIIKYNFNKSNYDDKYISEIYTKLSVHYKKQIMNFVLFDTIVLQNEEQRFKFVKNNFEQNGGIDYFDIKQKFNEILNSQYCNIITMYMFNKNIFSLFNVLYRLCLYYITNLFETQSCINLTKTSNLQNPIYIKICSYDKCTARNFISINGGCSVGTIYKINDIDRYFIEDKNTIYTKCSCGRELLQMIKPVDTQTTLMQELTKKEFVKLVDDIILNIKKLTENEYFVLATKIRILFDSRIFYSAKSSQEKLKQNMEAIYPSQYNLNGMLLIHPNWSIKNKIPDIFLRNIISTLQEYKNINKNFWNKIFSNGFFTKENIDLINFNITEQNEINPIVNKLELEYTNISDFNPFEIIQDTTK